MTAIRVEGIERIGDLANDCAAVARGARPAMARVVRGQAISGNRIAQASARRTAGAHGKHYANRFSPESVTSLSWVYGPKGRPQGEMSFEFGSRNQPPHLDLARSADVVAPRLAKEAGEAVGRLFW